MSFVSKFQARCKRQGGFTLIELLVALVIISISLLALGAFTLAVLSSDNVARQRTVATHLAEQELENWYSGAYVPAPGANGWPKTVNNTDYKLETFDLVPVTGVTSPATTSPPGTTTGTASQARSVTVYWQLKGTQKSVTINHLQRTP